MNRVVLLVALLGLVAVGSSSCNVVGRCMNLRQMSYGVTRLDEAKGAKSTPVRLRIVNRSEDYMLVRDVVSPDVIDGTLAPMQGPARGALTTDAGEILFDPRPQGETGPVFSRGLIPPGKALEVELSVRPVATPDPMKVYYTSLTEKEILQLARFQETTHKATGEIRFVPWSGEQLQKAAQERGPLRSKKLGRIYMTEELLKGMNCKAELPYSFGITE